MDDHDRELLDKVRSKAFTPGARDGRSLLRLLGSADKDEAKEIVTCLVRMGPKALELALAESTRTAETTKARLLEVVGKVASNEESAINALISALKDEHDRVVKVAARALGRLGAKGAIDGDTKKNIERALLDAKSRVLKRDLATTIVEALGKVGGAESLAALSDTVASKNAAARAKIVITRELAREPSDETEPAIQSGTRVPAAIDVRFYCREGLEGIVLEELGSRFRAKQTDAGLVDTRIEGTLDDIFVSRTATHVTFPIVDRALREKEDLATAIASEITSPRSRSILATFTRGRVRYRIGFQNGGHRRALVFDIASRVSAIEPAFLNEPKQSTWEVIVDDKNNRLRIELLPKALNDPRFAYRVADVPASSHPTVAAAIAFLGGAQEHDIVWDPFVGSGVELVERARLGPYAKLLGTDLEESALDAAKKNFAAAAITNFSLEKIDARHFHPEGVNLILTNPPMGRRIHPGSTLAHLLGSFVMHASRVLVSNGRMVWISPMPTETNPVVKRAGFSIERTLDVDMGGFFGTMQLLRKP